VAIRFSYLKVYIRQDLGNFKRSSVPGTVSLKCENVTKIIVLYFHWDKAYFGAWLIQANNAQCWCFLLMNTQFHVIAYSSMLSNKLMSKETPQKILLIFYIYVTRTKNFSTRSVLNFRICEINVNRSQSSAWEIQFFPVLCIE
jgi:hypothetical protein